MCGIGCRRATSRGSLSMPSRATRDARPSHRTPARTRHATSISASGLIALAIAKTRDVASLRSWTLRRAASSRGGVAFELGRVGLQLLLLELRGALHRPLDL